MNDFTKEELPRCVDCGHIIHDSENNLPGYSDLCSFCNSEWFSEASDE